MLHFSRYDLCKVNSTIAIIFCGSEPKPQLVQAMTIMCMYNYMAVVVVVDNYYISVDVVLYNMV